MRSPGPADLDEPLSAPEREEFTERFLASARSFAELVAAAGRPPETWDPWIEQALRPSPNSGEPLQGLLRRWWLVFEAELRLIEESRNRIAHGVPVTDGELRRADYLASRLKDITFREVS